MEERKSFKPFPGYTLKESKNTGANQGGPFGGVYKNDDDQTLALFKRDTKKEKARVGRVIGEAVSGALLNAFYTEMGVSLDRVAQVELVRANDGTKGIDERGDKTYLKSTYIKGYVSDFWAYAYQQKFVDKYVREYVEKQPEPFRFKPGEREGLIKLATIEANKKVAEMKRPSGMLSPNVRKVINHAILRKEDFIGQFAEIMIPRLAIADFGLHNANIGLAKTQDGNLQIVALDYGAGLRNLTSEVNPYARSESKTGAEFQKNHFLEYDRRIIMSEEMAKNFVKVGQVPMSAIDNALRKALDDVAEKYGVSAIKQFCKRIGMHSDSYEKLDDKNFLMSAIHGHIYTQMEKRQQSLLNQGYMLLLEHCLDKNGKVDQAKFENYIREGYPLDQFIRSEYFQRMEFVLHRNEDYQVGGINILASIPFDFNTPGYKDKLRAELSGAELSKNWEDQFEIVDDEREKEKEKAEASGVDLFKNWEDEFEIVEDQDKKEKKGNWWSFMRPQQNKKEEVTAVKKNPNKMGSDKK